MRAVDEMPPFESLDPEDWEAMRALAHRMIDDGLDYLRDVRERPVWTPPPESVQQHFESPAPSGPQDPQAVYEEFRENILPFAMGNIHPRFWAWYMGNGTVMGALAEFLAAVMNPNLGGGQHVANRVEAQVLDWMKDLLGFPREASGLLVSGGSMANLIGLTVARNHQAGFDLRREGVGGADARLVMYASSEVHSSNQKALELLGLGGDALRKVAVDDDYRIDIGALREAIRADRAAGLKPICVIGTSGTINTGAIDDLDALADLCRDEGLWFHVDGAIGAVAMLSDVVRPQLKGIERADSVALDLHKWMHMPFEAGCALVRNDHAHRETFALTPEYLEHGTRGLASGALWFSEYGPQLSRQFRALKIWMSVKEHGLDRFGRMISRNVAQAERLARMVDAEPMLQRMAPVGLDIVCFRYNPGGLNDERLDAINRELLIQLQERGLHAPSYTTLDGRYCLRVAIANHRSRDEDFDAFVRDTLQIGAELSDPA